MSVSGNPRYFRGRSCTILTYLKGTQYNKQKNDEQDTAIANLKQNALTAVTVKANSGLTGNGTTASPLDLDLSSILNALKSGNLLGEGLDVVDGKLAVKLNRIVDASGESKVTMGVNNG